MHDLQHFFNNKKVLITGHTGFKGSWLTLWLQNLGAKIVGYSTAPPFKNGIYELTSLRKEIVDYRANIKNLNKLKEVLKNENPEIIFHLAAQPLVLESYKNPLETIETNTLGTVNILESIRECESVRSAVIITTDKCYENKEQEFGYKETDSLGGFDPYSASKGAAEILIQSYIKSFFHQQKNIGIASARAGNVIGGGDWSKNRLVPDIFRALLNNQTIEIRNPNAIRPWQYVLEPLYGYLKLAKRLYEAPESFEGPWNFGPYINDNHSVKEVVDIIIKLSGKGKWIDTSSKNQPHEAGILLLDINKAINQLSWKPTLSFEETIEFTSNWYEEVNNKNVKDICLKQIKQFEKLCSLRNVN